MDLVFNYLTYFHVKMIAISFGLFLILTILLAYLWRHTLTANAGISTILVVMFGFGLFFISGMAWVNLATRDYHDKKFLELIGLNPPRTQRQSDRNKWFSVNESFVISKRMEYLVEIKNAMAETGQAYEMGLIRDKDINIYVENYISKDGAYNRLEKAVNNYREFNTYLGYYKDK